MFGRQAKFYPLSDFNPQEWNQWANQACPEFPYLQYQYLDRACAGQCYVYEDLSGAFIPFLRKRKMGVSYVTHPPFLQRLAILTPYGKDDFGLLQLIECFLKKFSYVQMKMQLPSFPEGELKGIERLDNFILTLGQELVLQKNHRRSLQRAKKAGIRWRVEQETGAFLEHLVAWNLKLNTPDLIPVATQLIKWAVERKVFRMLTAHVEDLPYAAGMGLIEWKGRLINLFPFTHPEGRKQGAMHYLIERLLVENPFQAQLLDFEGSEIPGVRRFYKGFGARTEHYYQLQKTVF